MQIQLHRTFSEYTKTQQGHDENDWNEYFGTRRGRLTWEDLHQNRLVVVLGEAGIGKTVEFQLEAKRLVTAGCPAFFLPLNLLQTGDDWELALGDVLEDFIAWENDTREGFFFLDAVDEARLHSHADFQRALRVVRGALVPHFGRVHLAISSRVTDWTVPEVASSVTTQLLQPMNAAILRATAESSIEAGQSKATETPVGASEELFVATLDALSREEAKRCARHFTVTDEIAFWAAVDDGDYDFMASRPLDLRWMVELWNQRKALGTYTELIEANIRARLSEVNTNYQQAGKALSEAQLRSGATDLAAAAEFGGYAYIAVQQSHPAEAVVLNAHVVLQEWKPADIQLLLTTAIFDEASFDRVKFHHRSIREYLAARWVDSKLSQGVPWGRLLPLFTSNVFRALALIPSRRAVLSWLAAMNVRVRQWVVSNFPEIFLYQGDPQSWDQLSADFAFGKVISAVKASPRITWSNSPSDYLRASHAVSPIRLAEVLGDDKAPLHAKALAYQLARHGKVDECATPAFAVYQDVAREEWERFAALTLLEVVGTDAHRDRLLQDVESVAPLSNKLRSQVIRCVNWTELAPTRLATVLKNTQNEGEHGFRPIAQSIKAMLPKTDLAGASLVLTAVLECLPCPAAAKPFNRFPAAKPAENEWLLRVLPACFERVLQLARQGSELPLSSCLEAADRIEGIRGSRAANVDEFKRLHGAIKDLTSLRWAIILAITQSENIDLATGRLVWSDACIVTCEQSDLPELARRAHDSSLPATIQETWFAIGVEVAFSLRNGNARTSALRLLSQGVKGPRWGIVSKAYNRWRDGARARRGWRTEQRGRESAREEKLARWREALLAKRAGITNGSDVESLHQLVRFAFNSPGWRDDSGVDTTVIAPKLGPGLTLAFADGLRNYWKKIGPLDPAKYAYGEVPWEALAALSGVSLSAQTQADFESLSTQEITTAARIAVWALPGPPSWFEPLHKAYSSEVEGAVNPWVLNEAVASRPGTGIRGALAMTLRCAPAVRRKLLGGVTPLVVSGMVTNQETLNELVPVLYADGLMPAADFDKLSGSTLRQSITASGRIEDMSWLRLWANARPHAAWNWFRLHLAMLSGQHDLQVSDFAVAMSDLKWVEQPWDLSKRDLLLEVARVLQRHYSNTVPESDTDSAFFGPPIKRMFDGIVESFVSMRGVLGYNALHELIATESDAERQWGLRGALAKHTELEAASEAQWTIVRLRNIHRAFDSEPRDEGQLYEQVIARLEEIRTSIEEGPFSERALFASGMPEKYLQLWLAAKFQDTQNLRFSVHREEEVDDDKLTDIQLACATAKVCVEIKPLDRDRKYSASSLIEDTLNRQMVGQYLRGRNSSSGILVLIQLDDKRWDLPHAKACSFDELVEYLQKAADTIKLSTPTVKQLHIFGMRCIR